jgi:hypothetical protein
VGLAELLYEVNRKLGTVTDYLLKQQGQLEDKDCNSFEAVFNILLRQAESREVGASVEEDSKNDKKVGTEHPGGVIALG